MKNKKLSFLYLLTILLFVACTAGPNSLKNLPKANAEPAGFILGLWHGFISLFTFIISLFSDKVNVYEVFNNGGWYNFGYILGISIFYGGGTKGAGGKRSNKNNR